MTMQMENMEREAGLLTVPEAADFLRLRPSTLRAWRLKRKLQFVKIGGRVFVREADARALIQKGLVPAISVSAEVLDAA
jgi:excisionase family DNA binding protein